MTLVLATNVKREDSLFYKIANHLLGNTKDLGEGSHHEPIGWLIMILSSVLFGLLMGFGLESLI